MKLLNYADLYNRTSALVRALKHRDLYTHLHSDRVVCISEEIGFMLKLSDHEINLLKISACLHDVGKIGIPDNILLKPGKHTQFEWEIMKSHSELGEDIVMHLELETKTVIAQAIRHHHEYFNGTGYPDGLSGNEIPLFSRIISVADSYDAMTSTRPHHAAKTHQQALDVMDQEKGIKSDPSIFSIFQALIENSENRVNEY